MKIFLLFGLCLIFIFTFTNLCNADTSNIGRLSFITEPQTVLPNVLSRYITLQIQDTSGNQVTALETIRFDAFQTTSPTGIFVSCTTPTNPPTDYISRNGSNKNICYKDSTEGVYTLTAKTNNTTNSLIATQTITISGATTPPGGGTGTTTSTSTDTTGTTTSTTTSSTSTGGGSYYVYSSPSYISTYEAVKLSVEAGRERLGFLHTPMQFKSNAFDKKTGQSVSGVRYSWTFGDGTSEEGGDVNHTYIFPGEYNVVLNSYSGSEDAVDTTRVKIISPEVKVQYADSYIEFTNASSEDLNIGGWKVRGNNKEYLIPRDTIIFANNSLKISSQTTGSVFGAEKLLFLYPDGQVVAEIVKKNSEEKQRQITEISEKLISLKNELDLAYMNDSEYGAALNNQAVGGVAESDPTKRSTEEKKELSVANVVSAPASQNVLSKIVDFFATMFK
jgi:hypothetical protein